MRVRIDKMANGFLRPTNVVLLILLITVFSNTCNGVGSCPDSSFSCYSGECVNLTSVCDKKADCVDGSDEADCDQCHEGWFPCADGNCILSRWVCDGENDCGDHSDEMNCGKIPPPCSDKQHRCHDNTKCIPLSWVCDGNADCKDRSDEVPGCVRTTPCNEFLCTESKTCIPKTWVCDASVDCEDGSDEVNCTGTEHLHCMEKDLKFFCKDKSVCLDKELVCNGVQNCDDGSDEGGQCVEHSCEKAGCSHGCFQTPRSAVCHCPDGYEAKGKDCLDVDECQTPGICSQICNNNKGSFTCSCVEGYAMDASGRHCEAQGPEPLLIYTATRELKILKLKSGVAHSMHHKLNHAVGVDYDSVEDRVYWTEMAEGVECIKSSKLDGSDIKKIISDGILMVEDIAIDWIAHNLYFTDSGYQRICVCKRDGTYCNILIDSVQQPRALALEPTQGIMFWSDWSHLAAIERCGMDGSARKAIVTKDIGWPNGLAIDHVTKQLYWIDGKLNRIETSALDGSLRRVLFGEIMHHPFSLAVFEDNFYWTDWNRRTLESCNKFTGKNHKVMMRETNADNIPMGVHVYHPLVQPVKNNPCWESGCAQLCLLAPGDKYACACQVGDILAPNGKSCLVNSTSTTFLSIEDRIYELVKATIGLSRLQALNSKAKMEIGAMAFNPVNNNVVYSDVGSDMIVLLDPNMDVQRSIVTGHLGLVKGVAVDWISGNIYWVDHTRGVLEVSRADGTSRKVLVDENLERPLHLVVDPPRGSLFVSLAGYRPRIEKMDMDGSQRHIFIDHEVYFPVSMAIDYNRERLYWADVRTGRVSYVSLEGKNRTVLDYKGSPISVAVTQNGAVWIDAGAETLSLYKYDESKETTSLLMHHPIGKKTANVLSTVKPLQKGTNGCGKDNGRCTHLCLANQDGFVCACPTGMVLGKNKLTCQNELTCDSREFECGDHTCIPLAFTCDNKDDCSDGSDEQNCKPSCTTKEFQCEDGTCIPSNWQCDRMSQCSDSSDEINCGNETCPPNHFTCGNGQCVYLNLKCDGHEDCLDKSDEMACQPKAACPDSYFHCKSGSCIPNSWRCDSEVDCRDGSDEDSSCDTERKKCNAEREFTCANGRCIDLELKCDTDDDCADGSDEKQCDSIPCPSNMYKCLASRRCILRVSLCDGFHDCPNGDDETGCLKTNCSDTKFQCQSDGRCIPLSWACDGENDCGDNSDEKLPQCHFVRSSSTTTSIPVFSDIEEEIPSAHGTKLATNKSVSSSRGGENKPCAYDEYQCGNGDCIPLHILCNHHHDCSDKSDEGPFCSTACTDNGGCGELCLPTPSGPVCRCRTGYKLLNDGMCEDIDECSYLGACSQYCYNTPGTFICSCMDGYKLRADQRSCKATGAAPELLLAFSTKLVSYTLGANHVKVISQNANLNIADVDFDTSKGDVYWLDYTQGAVFKYSKSSSNISIVLGDLYYPMALTVDWIAKLLIYFDMSGNLVICTMDGMNCSVILTIGYKNVKSLKVDARFGLIYWSTWSTSEPGDSGAIERICESGRRRVALVNDKIIWPTGLTLDYFHESLFWVDAHLQLLETIGLNGRNRRVIHRGDTTYPMHLATFEDRLYWADWGSNSIVDCEKFGCTDLSVLLENVVKVTALAIYHPTQQPEGSSPCLDSRKCSHICVTIPRGFACLCPKRMVFSDDTNTTCVNEEQKAPHNDDKGIAREVCDYKTCFNGGTCLVVKGVKTCECLPQFHGERCEIHILGSKPNDVEDHSWIAGVVLGITFILAVVVALLFYYKRFENSKLEGSFSPVPFENPTVDTEGLPEEPPDSPYAVYNTMDKTYRSYSNPMFDVESSTVDINSNIKNGKVQFKVIEQHSSESDNDCESATALI